MMTEEPALIGSGKNRHYSTGRFAHLLIFLKEIQKCQ